MTLLSKIIVNSIIELLVDMAADISASAIFDVVKGRKENKKALEGVLEELGELESESNKVIYYPDPDSNSDFCNKYFSKAQELKSLIVGTNKIRLSKKKADKCKVLYREIDQKLLIYWYAFVKSVDISSEERRRYYCQYIEPKRTDIQRLISELTK